MSLLVPTLRPLDGQIMVALKGSGWVSFALILGFFFLKQYARTVISKAKGKFS